MKLFLKTSVVAAIFGACMTLNAQSAALSGSTGQCKDGTYTTAASKSGACRGHKGIQTWYAASAATAAKPAAVAATKPKAATAAMPSKPAVAMAPAPAAKSSASTVAQAPGGGPGMVWVNTSTKVYHCPGTQFYGKTKKGSYMSESDAKAKGFRADASKPCK